SHFECGGTDGRVKPGHDETKSPVAFYRVIRTAVGRTRASASGYRVPPRIAPPPHCTAWIRLIISAYFGPYLSHTGFPASWNGFLSATCTTVIPAAFILSSACCSYAFHSTRSSCCASLPSFFS